MRSISGGLKDLSVKVARGGSCARLLQHGRLSEDSRSRHSVGSRLYCCIIAVAAAAAAAACSSHLVVTNSSRVMQAVDGWARAKKESECLQDFSTIMMRVIWFGRRT